MISTVGREMTRFTVVFLKQKKAIRLGSPYIYYFNSLHHIIPAMRIGDNAIAYLIQSF